MGFTCPAIMAFTSDWLLPPIWTLRCRFDELHGSDGQGNAVEDVPPHILESIKRNQVCLKGTLFTPLIGSNTSNQVGPLTGKCLAEITQPALC